MKILYTKKITSFIVVCKRKINLKKKKKKEKLKTLWKGLQLH